MMLGIVILAGGASLFAYRYFTRPVTLTVAAGSIDGEATALLSIVSSRLASASRRSLPGTPRARATHRMHLPWLWRPIG
ncbi:MAG: hypothetical protein WDO17_08340 [Alphaproteobacteria bacterium]